MELFFLPPSAETSALVCHYISLTNGDEPCADKFIPDGHVGFLFEFDDEDKFVERDKIYKLPKHFIVFPLIKHVGLSVTSFTDSFVVLCKAPVFTRLFKLRLNCCQEEPYLVTDAFNGFPMLQMLKELGSFEARVNFFEDYLKQNVLQTGYNSDEIDLVYEKIMNSGGNIRIDDLMKDVAMNHRSFRRCFISRVGLSAKELLRIVRVNHVWKLGTTGGKIDFGNIVYQCSFFDQSHFINDFKKIVGETPKEFFQRELSRVEFISGRKVN